MVTWPLGVTVKGLEGGPRTSWVRYRWSGLTRRKNSLREWTSPKSIDWGAAEKGRDYTPEDLKLIQSAEGKKVRMPNGQVLQSTWYRPPAYRKAEHSNQ